MTIETNYVHFRTSGIRNKFIYEGHRVKVIVTGDKT